VIFGIVLLLVIKLDCIRGLLLGITKSNSCL
jgi:hypothetical protein